MNLQRALRAAAIPVAIVATAVALWVALVGGFNVSLLHIQLKAHDPWRPALVAIGAVIVFAAAKGRWSDVRAWFGLFDRIDDRLVAVSLAAAVSILGIAYATTAAGGADSYGYVSEADGWLKGAVKIPQTWAQDAPWPSRRWSFAPLGWRPGDGDDEWSLVPTYSPGLPLLMAGAKRVGGQEGVFWVVPISGGLLVLATFGLGRRFGDPRAGVIAAALMATSPIVLFMLMAPMTDVPVAAAWTIAGYFALGESAGTAVAAGLAAAVGTLIRPNLVFQAGPIGLWFLIRGWRTGDWGRAIRHAACFSVAASCGIAAVATINQTLYGSPFISGYGALPDWYKLANIPINAANYTKWLVYAHTPVALVGLAALVVPLKRVWPGVKDRAVFVFIALYLSTLVGQFLAFLVFDVWWYLRFLIGMLPFILLGVAAVSAALVRAGKPALTVAVTVALIALCVRDFRVAAAEATFDVWQGERRYVAMGQIVKSTTDANGVIYSMQHSGSIRYYGGRLTLNWSNLDRDWLDRSVEWVTERGAHPYLVLESWEVDLFKKQFAEQKTLAILDTAPVLMYEGGAQIMLWDLAAPQDRAASTVNITETYANRLRSVPPAKPPTIPLGR